MIRLQEHNHNKEGVWDKIYTEDTKNHAWGTTWNIIDKMLKNYNEVYDHACGMGYYISHLKSIGKIVYGYERCKVAVNNIKKRDPELAVATEVPKKKFECVLCMDLLEHLEKPVELINTLLNMTKNKLIITVPARDGGLYHVWLFEEKDFSDIFNRYKIKQIIIMPPWGAKKRIVEVLL